MGIVGRLGGVPLTGLSGNGNGTGGTGGAGDGASRIVRIAGLGIPITALLGLVRLRLTVLSLLAVVRIGTLKLWLVKALVNVNVPVVVV